MKPAQQEQVQFAAIPLHGLHIDHSPFACWILPVNFEVANHQVFGWSTSWQTCSCTAGKNIQLLAIELPRSKHAIWGDAACQEQNQIVVKQLQNQREWLLNGLFGIFGIWSENVWAKDWTGDDGQISTGMTPDCKVTTPECKQIALYIYMLHAKSFFGLK